MGQRWSILLVRELLPGPRRFTDLLLPGLTPNVLSTRLRELEAAGLVASVALPPPARMAWVLTEAGRRLKPVVLALGAFGAAYLDAPEPDDVVSSRWFVVSLQRRYRGLLDGVRVQLWIDGVPYQLGFVKGRLDARDGEALDAEVTVRGTFGGMAAALSARPSGASLEVVGDRALWEAVHAGFAVG